MTKHRAYTALGVSRLMATVKVGQLMPDGKVDFVIHKGILTLKDGTLIISGAAGQVLASITSMEYIKIISRHFA